MHSPVDSPTACPSCQSADLEPGSTTETLEKEGTRLIVYNVPSYTCTECGATHLGAEARAQIKEFFDEARRKGVQVSIRRYRIVRPTS